MQREKVWKVASRVPASSASSRFIVLGDGSRDSNSTVDSVCFEKERNNWSYTNRKKQKPSAPFHRMHEVWKIDWGVGGVASRVKKSVG